MINRAGTVQFTVLMRYVLDALCTKPEEPMTTHQITATGGQYVTPSQLPAALNKLRKMKWIKREKRTIGERLVGANYYPEIKNFYVLQPGRAALWAAIEPQLDLMGRIEIDALSRAQQDIDEQWAERNLESMRKGTELEQITEPEQPAAEEYVPHKEPFFKWHTIMDEEIRGGRPYMTRIIVGRLRLHVFHRGDLDADPHDHPWDFWTFPLRSYVEEIAIPDGKGGYQLRQNVVKRFRFHFRPAEHTHRVLGAYAGYVLVPPLPGMPMGMFMTASADEANLKAAVRSDYSIAVTDKRIVTLVWRGKFRREWGFWKKGVGKWCWQVYHKYIWNGGRNEPCGD